MAPNTRMIRVPFSHPRLASVVRRAGAPGRFAGRLLFVNFVVALQGDLARGAEARAFTFAHTSGLADGIRHSAAGPNVAAPEAASVLAGGGFGFASAYAAGTRDEVRSHYAPALQVRAYGRAGGEDHGVGGGGTATASWTDRLSYRSVLVKSVPPTDFLRTQVIFQFHVSGAIQGPAGAARCSYSLTVEAMDEDGERVTYGRTGSYPAPGEITVLDRFGRRLNERGMTLVDWEGQIANPAVGIEVVPPGDTTFPAVATITSPQPRLYFDEPCEVGASGPVKTLVFTDNTPQSLRVGIFPDADGQDEDWPVTIRFQSANGAIRTLILPAHVLDQDQPRRAVEFPIAVDFSQDRTGFFADESRRALYRRLANDWAYFFADPGLDVVPAGRETTFIWNPTGFDGGTFVQNASPYRGYLLYAYGIDQSTPPFRSGGEPSAAGGFLTAGGQTLGLRRSGGQELEVKGNFNRLGWFLSAGDDDWWRATNLGDVPNDLASIPHHELGHALIFNPAQPAFAKFKAAGRVEDPRVQAYQGDYPAIDEFDHLSGSVDRLSGKGAFGYEYFGTVPARRWLITKLDLLVAQAIGYPLRETSPFQALKIASTGLPRGWVNGTYAHTLQARGGVPFYRWAVAEGSLPPGLTLDSFTGRISGKPTTAGQYAFTARLEDYDTAAAPAEKSFILSVTLLPLEITGVRSGPAGIEVSFRTLAGHAYRLEYSDDLLTWSTVGTDLAGTGDVVTANDSSGLSARQRFYRAVELWDP